MEYVNIDEATRYQEACRKVKQIAEAIKHIRIKYYPNFGKISEADKQVYDELNAQIEKIAGENGLNRLRTELISEIADRYDGNIPSENEKRQGAELNEKVLKAYYGAIDAGKQALSEGKLKKARNCQKQADTYMKKLEEIEQSQDGNQLVEMATHYKREKFAELVPARETGKNNKTNWEEVMRSSYKTEDVQTRNEVAQEIAGQAKGEETVERNANEMILE